MESIQRNLCPLIINFPIGSILIHIQLHLLLHCTTHWDRQVHVPVSQLFLNRLVKLSSCKEMIFNKQSQIKHRIKCLRFTKEKDLRRYNIIRRIFENVSLFLTCYCMNTVFLRYKNSTMALYNRLFFNQILDKSIIGCLFKVI